MLKNICSHSVVLVALIYAQHTKVYDRFGDNTETQQPESMKWR